MDNTHAVRIKPAAIMSICLSPWDLAFGNAISIITNPSLCSPMASFLNNNVPYRLLSGGERSFELSGDRFILPFLAFGIRGGVPTRS
jgi:hypothetical protein